MDVKNIRQRIINKDTTQLENLIKVLENTIHLMIPALYDYWRAPMVVKRYNKKLNKLIIAEKKNSACVDQDWVKITLNDEMIAAWKVFSRDFDCYDVSSNISGIPFSNYDVETQH